jgi:peroxiredoxin Q/BCP
MALKAGEKAPAFKLASSEGGEVSLSGLKGQRFVLYFYPKDDTPGCTQEACDFRDNLARLKRAGVPVYGVSQDSLTSHEKFRTKYKLPFALLSDPDNGVATAFGAYGKKMMYGKAVQGTIRSTFVVGADGRIEHAWSPVRVKGHVDAVLAAVSGEAPSKPEPKKKAR